jgi:hypothetical protein
MKKIIILFSLLFSSVAFSFGWKVGFFKTRNITLKNGSRTYYDGTVAKSCYEYKTKKVGSYQYAGDVGDGVYTISYNGETASVFCDMTRDDGGWTLVVKLGDYDLPNSLTTGSTNLNLLTDANSIGIGTVYGKISDAMINGIRSKTGNQDIVYKIEKQKSSFNADYGVSYFSGQCSFGAKTGPSIYASYQECAIFTNDYTVKTLTTNNQTWCNQPNISPAYFCDGSATKINRVQGYLGYENHNWINYLVWVR